MEDQVYAITYKEVVQIGPDDWETYNVTIELGDHTTLLDIKKQIAEHKKTTVDKVNLKGMKIGVIHKINNF